MSHHIAIKQRINKLARHVTKLKQEPLPVPKKDVANVLKESSEELAQVIAADITAGVNALVPKESRDLVSRRKDLGQQWPLYVAHGRMPAKVSNGRPLTPWVALWLARQLEPGTVPQDIVGIDWPPTVAPVDVAEWVAGQLQGPEQDRWRDMQDLVRMGAHLPALAIFPTHDPRNVDCPWPTGCTCEAKEAGLDGGFLCVPPGGLALLYIAEKTAQQIKPKRFDQMLLSSTRPSVRCATALRGADAIDNCRPHRVQEETEFKVTFKWAGTGVKEPQQLELSYAGNPDDDPFLQIRYVYGDAAVRDVLGYTALSWAAGARAGQGSWVFIDELLELCGLKDNKDNRKAVRDRLTRFNKTTMTVTTNEPAGRVKTKGKRKPRSVSQALVTSTSTAAEGEAKSAVRYAVRVEPHPALFWGITREDGSAGNKWWSSPIGLLSAPSSSGVHTASIIACNLWRGSMTRGNDKPRARIRLREFADRLGVDQVHSGISGKEKRAADYIRRTLDVMKETGIASDWSHDGGDFDHLEGVICIWPGLVGPPNRPGWIPATGTELKGWLKRHGLTQKQLADMIDVSAAAIKSSVAGGFIPISPGVRRALRMFLRQQHPTIQP